MAKPRTTKSAFFRIIESSPLPIYAVSPDMKIIFCNEALCQLTGQDADTITELTCVYQSSSDQPLEDQLATGLCPPPDGFGSGPSEGWVTIPLADRVEYRQASFIPTDPGLGTTSADSRGLIVIVHGPPKETPQPDFSPDESPNRRALHVAISQMQYESATAINIDRLVGRSPQSLRTRRQIDIAGRNDCNVMIMGPKGSGRHNLGPLIHFADGPQMAGPLIPIQCAISNRESVQETIKELYRTQQQYPDEPLGRVFLEQVDQLSHEAQEELLGFLELPDFRLPLIATSLPDGQDHLLPDLWQNLSTITVELAPLADRRQDIPFLVQAVIEQFNSAQHSQLAGVDEDTMVQLVRYHWPGELEELTDAIDSACRSANQPLIGFDDLPHHLRIAFRFDSTSQREKVSIDLDGFLNEIEDELVARAVAYTNGNKSEAARLLGISRPRLLRRLEINADTDRSRSTPEVDDE